MSKLLEYIVTILPGGLLFAATYRMLPRKKAMVWRIFVLIMGFILVRDAMTPAGLWEFGLAKHALWIRLIHDHSILLGLGAISMLLTVGVVGLNPSLRSCLKWRGESIVQSMLAGLFGSMVICLPSLLIYPFVDVSERGGEVAYSLLFPLIFMALAGTLLEELLFRGYLQGYFENFTGKYQAAFLSGLAFAAGHAYLATTVTHIGWPILAFTLYMGIICSFVRVNYGLIGSTFAHGFAIFLLSAGLF